MDKTVIKDHLEDEVSFLYEKYKDDEETVEKLELIRVGYFKLFNMIEE